MASTEVDYKRYLDLLKRDKKLCIIIALVVMTVVTAVSYVIPNKYESSSTVFIEKSVISELLKGLTFTPSTEDKIKVLTYALNSRTLITKVIDELDLKKKGDEAELENLIKNLQTNTQIKIKDREGLFVISFRDRSPKLARDYVNALVRRYIDENTSSKRTESYGATQFLTEQLDTFKDKLLKSEEEANAFKRGQGSVATMDPSSLLKDINDSQARADDLKIRQAQLESAITNLGKINTVQSAMPALQKRLQELQLQYTDNYPEIVRLKDEIRALEEQKKNSPVSSRATESPEYQRMKSELNAMRQAEANIHANIARNRSLLQNIPAAKAKLDDLEREKQSQKNLYESMLSRQGQSEVSKQMTVQDKSTVFRVVDPALLPIKPVSPDRVKLIVLGILAGIGCGIGVIVLKDQLDDSVKNIDMAKMFGVPILAIIPRIDDPQLIATQSRKDRKLYIVAGLYFLVILSVLVMEAHGVTVLLDLMRKIKATIL
jgi:polysaccharide chain length determinant protein (PEP-CTERM system associated)